MKQFPCIFLLMNNFQLWFVEKYLADLAVVYRWHTIWAQQIQSIKAGADDYSKERGRPTIFETLQGSDLSPHDKSVTRLVDDAQAVVGAGSITASLTLALIAYYILSDQSIETNMVDELTQAIPKSSIPLPLARYLPSFWKPPN